MKFETSIKTIEEIVTDKYEFIIPVYQRPYVWDDEEIKKLLGDMLSTFETSDKSRYFVGNTYVVKSSNKNRVKQYELIDGQQRFTTFWLIAHAFNLLDVKTEITKYLKVTHSNETKDIRFDFDIRIEVANYMKGLLDNSPSLEDVGEKEFLKYIAKGVVTIKNFIASGIKEEQQRAAFGDYIYKNVNFVFNVAPENTDLNALFTALGTSGIQLQQSDILKSQLLAKVSKDSRIKYSKIWEACEDMTNYFEKNISVFPNPTNDFLFVKNADNQLFIEDIQVKNVLGQTVEIFYNDNKIDVSALNNAVYLLEIKTNKGTFAKKIIKN